MPPILLEAVLLPPLPPTEQVVLDTSRDGRFGYGFSVNPGGARYDALVDPSSGTENANWDGLWEAGTHIDERGWSVEIRIRIATLSYKKGLRTWNPNVEGHIQRLQEVDRRAGVGPDYKVTQTNFAGLLTGMLPWCGQSQTTRGESSRRHGSVGRQCGPT